MDKPQLSIVIPTWERSPMVARLATAIDACRVGGIRTETLVVSNFVDDKLSKALSSLHLNGEFRLLIADQKGANASRNLGLKEARSEFVLFVDDDCLPAEPNLFERYLEELAAHPNVAGVGGPYGAPLEAVSDIDLAIHFRTDAWLKNWNRNPNDALYLLGGNALYRKDILREIGGFNGAIAYGGTETDLNLRLVLAGHCLNFRNHLVMNHYSETSLEQLKEKGFAQGFSYQRRKINQMVPPERFSPGDLTIEELLSQQPVSEARRQTILMAHQVWLAAFQDGAKAYADQRQAKKHEIYL